MRKILILVSAILFGNLLHAQNSNDVTSANERDEDKIVLYFNTSPVFILPLIISEDFFYADGLREYSDAKFEIYNCEPICGKLNSIFFSSSTDDVWDTNRVFPASEARIQIDVVKKGDITKSVTFYFIGYYVRNEDLTKIYKPNEKMIAWLKDFFNPYIVNVALYKEWAENYIYTF